MWFTTQSRESWRTHHRLISTVNTVQFHNTFCYEVSSTFLILVQYSVISYMRCWMIWDEKQSRWRRPFELVRQRWRRKACRWIKLSLRGLWNAYKTKPHVVLESNSLCVHRLQVLHCMTVWDGDDTHLTVLWSMYNVYESSAEPWVQRWRDGNGGHVYMHRDLSFLAWLQVATCKCCTATALMRLVTSLSVSFDCENTECVKTRRYTTSIVYLWENSTGCPCAQKKGDNTTVPVSSHLNWCDRMFEQDSLFETQFHCQTLEDSRGRRRAVLLTIWWLLAKARSSKLDLNLAVTHRPADYSHSSPLRPSNYPFH